MGIFYPQQQNARDHSTMPALIPMINRRLHRIIVTQVCLAADDGCPWTVWWRTGCISLVSRPWIVPETPYWHGFLPVALRYTISRSTCRQYV